MTGGGNIHAGSSLSFEAPNYISLRNTSASGYVAVLSNETRIQKDDGSLTYYTDKRARPTITTATTTLLTSYVTASNLAYTAIGKVTVRNSTDNQAMTMWIIGLFRNVAGTLTQVGTTQPLFAPMSDAGQTGLSLAFGISGTTLQLNLVSDSTDTLIAAGKLEVEIA
jgi:hypothetical protein